MSRKALLFAFLFSVLAVFALAQEHTPANPQPPSQPQVSVQPEHQAQRPRHEGLQRQLTEESKEAAGEDEEAAFKHSPSVRFVARMTGTSLVAAYWLCIIFNFAVIAIAIVWGMKKALPGAFRDRTASIKKAMEDARTASEAANRRLSEIEGRLSRLDQEIASLRSSAEQEGRAEEERIRAGTEEDRQKVVQTAEQEIAAAARTARNQLKAYVAELAVSIAEQKIRVGQNEDRELVRSFGDNLGKDGK
jgi:F-type H+-transporting ATPase subunit b